MKIIYTTSQLQSIRDKLNCPIGFVATMGALHQGHISLIKDSIVNNEITFVSIFVNPTQFLDGEDFNKYPKSLESDINICKAKGVDYLFIPDFNTMYTNDEILIKSSNIKGYILEGYNRPTHFDGVLNIVLKLFNLIRPTNAYFGRKDAQQLMLIKQMVKNLFLDINIVQVDIVRDKYGLALSSRHIYLSNKDIINSHKIYKSLKIVYDKVHNSKELDITILKDILIDLMFGLKIEYIEILNRDFEYISKIDINNSIILVAVKFKTTRLIDNILV